MPWRLQDQPHQHIKPKYGQILQYIEDEDSSPPTHRREEKLAQEVLGVFLHYGRAIDSKMLTALGSIGTQQAAPTENIMHKIHQYLYYAATHPDGIITLSASDMFLSGHRDASNLSEKKACSRAGGHFFLSNNSTDYPNNGAFLIVTQIIKVVMSSAAKAELGAFYMNCRKSTPSCHTLIAMGHPQPPTPMETDNTTVLGVINNTIAPRRTKAMYMRLHRLHCRECRIQFWHTGDQVAPTRVIT